MCSRRGSLQPGAAGSLLWSADGLFTSVAIVKSHRRNTHSTRVSARAICCKSRPDVPRNTALNFMLDLQGLAKFYSAIAGPRCFRSLDPSANCKSILGNSSRTLVDLLDKSRGIGYCMVDECVAPPSAGGRSGTGNRTAAPGVGRDPSGRRETCARAGIVWHARPARGRIALPRYSW